MKVYVILCASLLSQVYTQETNPLLNLLSQGVNEPITKQKYEKKSQKTRPEDHLHQFQHNEDPVDKSLIHDSDYQESVTEKSTKSSTTVTISDCQYWCVTPENKFYCCDDDSYEDLGEHLDVCPVIQRACHVTDANLGSHFPREDAKQVSFPDMFKEESCIISSEVLKHLRLYHQRHYNIYNKNISVIEVFGSQHNKVVIAPKFFGHRSDTFGVFKEDLHDKFYERPFFRALKLALNIGTLTKAVPHIPHLTIDPGREHYSDRYTIYDSYLPEVMLTSKEYDPMLSEEDVLTSNKDESLLLSRIARYVYDIPEQKNIT